MARLKLQLPTIISSLLACWAFAISSGTTFAEPAKPKTGPSFSCAGRLTETETAICVDPALSAYDRAMAWAHARGWLSSAASEGRQARWLVRRNSCAGIRNCILSAYHSWISQLDFDRAPSSNFERSELADNHGKDLILGNLQSPTGSVAPLGDRGELFVQPMGGNWFLFRAFATHSYDPHDGRGPNVSTSDVTGFVQLSRGSGTWYSDLEAPDRCSVRLIRVSPDHWRIIETGACSGLGATLTGNYRGLKG
jgi:hypothetical protein